MNPNNLSAGEILRMCEPETELEKRLFDLVAELDSEIHYLESVVEPDCDCEECEDFDHERHEIQRAIELIEAGRVSDALEKMKGII